MARLGAMALMALVFAGCGGTEVQGVVREEGTGEPLSGATVQLGDETARTDEGGVFELDVDDDAPAVLEVEAVGYEPQKIDVNMDDGRALPSDVNLKKESEERVQTRARFTEEQRRLDECEQKLEDEERRLYVARRDFMNRSGPAVQRDQALQQFDAWQARLGAEEEKLEAEERAMYEARRDFDTHAIDTWTPAERANQIEDADEAAKDRRAEEAGEAAEDEAEDAADAVRKADEAAKDRAEEARDER